MLALLKEPLVLLFAVSAAGFLLGRLRLGSFHLGVAAVLFVGLGVSALVPGAELPDLVPQLGLALFIYSVGISSGPGFFRSFRARGLRDAGLALGALGVGAAVAYALAGAHAGSLASAAGLFCGALTNTPALGAVVETLRSAGHDPRDAVVAYSVAYPVGVLGVMAALWLVGRWAGQPQGRSRDEGPEDSALETAVVRLTAPDVLGQGAEAVRQRLGGHLVFGRFRRDGQMGVVSDDTVFAPGDDVVIVGARDELPRLIRALGEVSTDRLDLDRRVVDFRRIFVSSSAVIGVPLHRLRLFERFGAVLTRVRRGDVEWLPDGDTELELGDRVRVVALRSAMASLTRFFGDSYQALGEVDVLTFGLGIVLGLLVGKVPLPLPGEGHATLGTAGGTLLVALALGRLGRTGPLVWSLPYSASSTLRQLGLVLFLAGVGTRSGQAFAATVGTAHGLVLLGQGAAVTFAVAFSALFVGHRVFHIPFPFLAGMVAGVHTQPAVLAWATERAPGDQPRLGYAAAFPVAMVAKILLAQVLLALR